MREILLLDQRPNRNLRVAFLFPVTVTKLQKTEGTDAIDGQVFATVPPEALNKAADAVQVRAGVLGPLTPKEIDPVAVSVLSDKEIDAIAAGSLVLVLTDVQLEEGDTPDAMLAKKGPGYAQILLMYQQQFAELMDSYAKRAAYLGLRLDAS